MKNVRVFEVPFRIPIHYIKIIKRKLQVQEEYCKYIKKISTINYLSV